MTSLTDKVKAFLGAQTDVLPPADELRVLDEGGVVSVIHRTTDCVIFQTTRTALKVGWPHLEALVEVLQ